MSHELRTPLNAILGYSHLLMKTDELAARERDRLGVINTSGEHLLRLINDVLDLAKIEVGKMELHEEPIALRAFLENIAANAELRAREKGLEFRAEFAGDLPARVIGDAAKLRQVLENLLGNAIKFTARGSVALTVRVERAPLEQGERSKAMRYLPTPSPFSLLLSPTRASRSRSPSPTPAPASAPRIASAYSKCSHRPAKAAPLSRAPASGCRSAAGSSR